MRELTRNDWWIVLHDEQRSVIVLRRTSTPLPLNGKDINILELQRSFASISLASTGLLIDLRDGPLRNDAAFESAAKARMHDTSLFEQRFARTATLVKTAVGKLQTTRLQREGGLHRKIFLDENEALNYLATG